MNFESKVKIITGLGNPGLEYAGTRHNAGFMVIDRILEKLPREAELKNYCSSQVYQVRFKGRELFLQKPQTFMNLSGEAVKQLLNKLQLGIENLLVIHDELDLNLGRLRICVKGSSGGHNGINSIIENLNNRQDFLRIRVGISRGKNIIDYVLSDFDGSEKELIQKAVDRAADAAIAMLSVAPAIAMNKFNCLDLSSENEENREQNN